MLEIIQMIVKCMFEWFDWIAKPVGMVVLILLMIGSLFYCTLWLIKKLWKGIVFVAGMCFFFLIFYTIIPLL